MKSARTITVDLSADGTWHVNHGGPGMTADEAARAMTAIAAAAAGAQATWDDHCACEAVVSRMLDRSGRDEGSTGAESTGGGP